MCSRLVTIFFENFRFDIFFCGGKKVKWYARNGVLRFVYYRNPFLMVLAGYEILAKSKEEENKNCIARGGGGLRVHLMTHAHIHTHTHKG